MKKIKTIEEMMEIWKKEDEMFGEDYTFISEYYPEPITYDEIKDEDLFKEYNFKTELDLDYQNHFKYIYQTLKAILRRHKVVYNFAKNAYEKYSKPRVNGMPYISHPEGMIEKLIDLFGIEWVGFGYASSNSCAVSFDIDVIVDVCLLHDVIEDTTITIDDILKLYLKCFKHDHMLCTCNYSHNRKHKELWLMRYFPQFYTNNGDEEEKFKNIIETNILTPLRLITHDKNEKYIDYINRLSENLTASIVKMLDLSDNLILTNLNKIGDYEVQRSENYIHYFKILNDKWHILEYSQYSKSFLRKKD